MGVERYYKDMGEVSQKASQSVRNFKLDTKRSYKRRMSFFADDYK